VVTFVTIEQPYEKVDSNTIKYVPYEKVDSNTIKYVVSVLAGGESEVEYTVEYNY